MSGFGRLRLCLYGHFWLNPYHVEHLRESTCSGLNLHVTCGCERSEFTWVSQPELNTQPSDPRLNFNPVGHEDAWGIGCPCRIESLKGLRTLMEKQPQSLIVRTNNLRFNSKPGGGNKTWTDDSNKLMKWLHGRALFTWTSLPVTVSLSACKHWQ